MHSAGTTSLSPQRLNVSRTKSESPFVLRPSDNVTVVHAASGDAEISRLAEVDCRGGLLSEIELIERGSACSVLLAPFGFDRPVGTFHGSGSFGDAIFLRRTLIMPRFADTDEEFFQTSVSITTI